MEKLYKPEDIANKEQLSLMMFLFKDKNSSKDNSVDDNKKRRAFLIAGKRIFDSLRDNGAPALFAYPRRIS